MLISGKEPVFKTKWNKEGEWKCDKVWQGWYLDGGGAAEAGRGGEEEARGDLFEGDGWYFFALHTANVQGQVKLGKCFPETCVSQSLISELTPKYWKGSLLSGKGWPGSRAASVGSSCQRERRKLRYSGLN